jgi:hypothetical protein
VTVNGARRVNDLGKAAFSISCGLMRPVTGLDRAGVQWMFVAIGVALIVVAGGEAVSLRRARARIDSLQAQALDARLTQQQLENHLAHERATGEALSLELARVRGSDGSMRTADAGRASAAPPTLTLTPLGTRGARPPDATVAQPAGAQSIQLRLVLPRRRPAPSATYAVAIRTWSRGETLWQRSGLIASAVDGKPMVTTFITGDVFAAGAYEIALTAGDPPSDVAAYEVAVASDFVEVKGKR